MDLRDYGKLEASLNEKTKLVDEYEVELKRLYKELRKLEGLKERAGAVEDLARTSKAQVSAAEDRCRELDETARAATLEIEESKLAFAVTVRERDTAIVLLEREAKEAKEKAKAATAEAKKLEARCAELEDKVTRLAYIEESIQKFAPEPAA